MFVFDPSLRPGPDFDAIYSSVDAHFSLLLLDFEADTVKPLFTSSLFVILSLRSLFFVFPMPPQNDPLYSAALA